jgi:hypothetical protein
MCAITLLAALLCCISRLGDGLKLSSLDVAR